MVAVSRFVGYRPFDHRPILGFRSVVWPGRRRLVVRIDVHLDCEIFVGNVLAAGTVGFANGFDFGLADSELAEEDVHGRFQRANRHNAVVVVLVPVAARRDDVRAQWVVFEGDVADGVREDFGNGVAWWGAMLVVDSVVAVGKEGD